ncbi:MAG: alpha-glucosidase [Spirochaetales bacterium]|nr:alpha-glucosidase [Spirochaetales bacterium]
MDRKWWKEAVVYQVYPRSFFDSNGDGIGDLKGITEKLDYIKSLGVDVVWLNPVYASPNDDNGYDISNYFEIMQEFGTMSDWEDLLAEMHRRGLRMIMDLVVNHTSDEHQWFVSSRASRESKYRDYYIWRDAEGGKRPNDWGSHFSGPAWTWDSQTEQYYLHLFTGKQPDLNWENEKVREDVFTMMRWWLDKGIDGFRMDTINMISKVPGFPSVSSVDDGKLHYAGRYFTNGPHIHDYLREMNEKVLSRYDIMSVGECPLVAPELAVEYTSPEAKQLNMLFQFEHMGVDHGIDNKWEGLELDLVKFKSIISKWQTGLHGRGWNSNYLMNHDQPRSVSRFGDDKEFRVESAKMLLTFLLTLEGTPYIYQGEEIGMINSGFTDISEYRDVEIINHNQEIKESGGDLEKALAAYARMGRDNSRTPMQWTAGKNAGFSTGRPWINLARSWKEINVEADLATPDSIIKYFKELVGVRKRNLCLVYGEYVHLLPDDSRLFIYRRLFEDESILVILNFSGEEVELYPGKGFDPDEPGRMKLGICNYPAPGTGSVKMIRPFEARIYWNQDK